MQKLCLIVVLFTECVVSSKMADYSWRSSTVNRQIFMENGRYENTNTVYLKQNMLDVLIENS